MKARFAHGHTVEAPAEQGFVDGETPKPGRARIGADTEKALHPLWLLAKILVGLALVVGAAGAVAWGAYRYALTTPRFALQHFELVGARRSTAPKLAELAGMSIGQNLLGLDLDASESKIAADPWIRRVRLTRKLPSTLLIEIEENEASAIALLSDSAFLVTREGVPFKPLKPEDPSDLPLISGVSAEDVAKDRPTAMARLATGVEILRQYERLQMSKIHPAQEVHLELSGKVRLTVGDAGITLELGSGSFRRKLLMAERVTGQLRSQNRTPGILFLDNEAHTERVVVRMK
mgnify:CR=1 FL=1